jgi:hypothetical protein
VSGKSSESQSPFEPVYIGQNWAEGRSIAENFGGLITIQLSSVWSLAAGVFRSISDNPLSFSDFYVNVEANGNAAHLVVGYRDQSVFSTSGETRLIGHFSLGRWGHEVVLLARGRNTLARYGGADIVDVGPSQISHPAQVPHPTPSFWESAWGIAPTGNFTSAFP